MSEQKYSVEIDETGKISLISDNELVGKFSVAHVYGGDKQLANRIAELLNLYGE